MYTSTTAIELSLGDAAAQDLVNHRGPMIFLKQHRYISNRVFHIILALKRLPRRFQGDCLNRCHPACLACFSSLANTFRVHLSHIVPGGRQVVTANYSKADYDRSQDKQERPVCLADYLLLINFFSLIVS